ncbi:MAG: acyl carrier protein [Tabrizicola sp.]|uniref:acyl carrier protein n=1 Tax=Tabrizicola sp. TaxID=2005166 RepID=UPI002733F425|nr:acyl carrier protein [Tabrizicola sp.]MDP3263367.1 acyl carrier protein [Tabrizicola sp.]MDP3646724.1 acyl carrier protein [Paracoccaceae bacterium]MDZ4068130.1 acyl carrier protein [Tabrizicola sp.]
MTAEIEAAVIGILARQALLPEAAVPPDARMEEIGLDSLGMAEALFALEERFDISIPFNANAPDAAQFDMTSVQSVVQAVERLIAQKAA